MSHHYRSKIQHSISVNAPVDWPPATGDMPSRETRVLTALDLDAIRTYRLQRIRAKLIELDYAGIVVTDPINIRYATDSRNMQVWSMRNPMRYCFVATEGPVVLFEFLRCMHLSSDLPLVDELRPAQPWLHLAVGNRMPEFAHKWAAELADLVRRHGGGNARLAVDRCNPEGVWALQGLGIDVRGGEEVMECARAVKCKEEIAAMRCAIAACEEALDVMQGKLEPGITEQRLWSYLHAENIARGGEFIETRLLASGPRTNPWYQECSERIIEAGDLVSFDTDLIGAYGMCVDISRTWLCGDVKPTAEQKELYQTAYEQICYNRGILKAGLSFREVAEKAFPLAPDFLPNRYTLLYHGAGLADEYPALFYPEDWSAVGYDGVLEPNMVICVESYIGRVGGKEGVKLEEQLLITENGAETLSTCPYDERLGA
jgi:Xaa-Pro dipeptidase